MTIYAAHRYLVGGLYTHGGDIEWEIDEQPASLVRAWTEDDGTWAEFVDEDGPFWTPIDDNGQPLSDGIELTWAEFLQEFGPVYDENTLVNDDCAVPA